MTRGGQLLHTSFQAGRRLGKACTAQFTHIRLRAVLILSTKLYWHVNIADTRWASQRSIHGQNHP
jgi:hypothetical protein